MATELRISAGSFAWALHGICRLHRIPVGAALVLQQFQPPYSLLSLQQAALALGLNPGARNARASEQKIAHEAGRER